MPSTYRAHGEPRGRRRPPASGGWSRRNGPVSASRPAAAPARPKSRVAHMGERTKYTPGTFSWADVSTSDQPAAKDFYSGLFGWEANDSPVGDGVFYSMMQIDGKSVTAVSPQPQQQREAGVPPLWNSYITVAGAAAAAEKPEQLGAPFPAPPFDVMAPGRMAV